MSTPKNASNIPQAIEDQLALYFDNQATPQVVQAIQSWLEADPANAQTFAEYGYIERMIFCAQKKEDASAIFGLLAEMEENAEAELVTFVGELPQHTVTAPLAANDFKAASAYLLRHALTPKRLGIMATAAALLIGAVLMITLMIVTSSSPEVAQTPDEPTVQTAVIVAKLTDEHEAQWAEHPIARGTELSAGQRLTLTAGFAEITTNRGAIAVLEAPATIELIDSPNALRLHAGHLVGICETESSKGFLVRTPRMDIIDLGTRFGVSVTQDQAAASVFTGEVRVDSPASAEQTLIADQTMRIQTIGNTDQVTIENKTSDAFLTLLASPILDPTTRFRPRFVSGSMQWDGTLPSDLNGGKVVSNHLHVFLERQAVELEGDLSVDLTSQSPESDLITSVGATIEAGQRVDVYLFHLDTPNSDRLVQDYTLAFDRPILGVITTGEKLYQADALLGNESTQYPQHQTQAEFIGRGLESGINEFDDQVTIDGQVLELKLSTSSYIDQVRVLVQALPEDRN